MSTAVSGHFLGIQNSGPGVIESIVGIAIYMAILIGLGGHHQPP